MYESPNVSFPAESARVRLQRPGKVTAALIMTFVGSAALILIGIALLTAASRMDSLDLTSDDVTLLQIVGGISVPWGIACIVLAIRAWRGSSSARVVLLSMAAVYVLIQLFQVFAFRMYASALPIIYVAIIYRLLKDSQSKEWFSAPRR